MITLAQEIFINTILTNNNYSRDQKLMKLKSYLSKFKAQFNIDYTYVASQLLKDYYDKLG